ncbi:MAG: L-serine ammonia-lyase [Planctomycetota bacterium]
MARTASNYVSVFDLFKIGIGPSSSHSVGPMLAAKSFIDELASTLDQVGQIRVELFGSLALTGLGHATDTSVIMGLEGEQPDTIDPECIQPRVSQIRTSREICLGRSKTIPFVEEQDLVFNRRETLKAHSNAIRFQAFRSRGESPIVEATYYSIGGGFIVREGADVAPLETDSHEVPFPFASGKELLDLADEHDCALSDLAWRNENALRSSDETKVGLERIWKTMRDCVDRGCRTEGILPGGLNIERRAPSLFKKLSEQPEAIGRDPMCILDWVDLYALAVNEENAAGGRVVTAPTNGAAGIIPAVLCYLERFRHGVSSDTIERFLLTAGVIGSLYKRNASISGAEVGCQGEVGVACSMAAGALTEALGGSPHQVEEAAEIGMEHNLGLTCDPIKGLVQVPCIERNAMGAVKAINAARLAMRGDGKHFVSLDRVIRVMKRTGADMSARYKETSRGGLAVNISEC